MNGAFYLGATSLQAHQRALETIANNVANINTNGFKRSSVRFVDLVSPPSRDLPPTTRTLSSDNQTASGVQATASPRIFEQGQLRNTGRLTDVAIDGDGFLELLGPEGRLLLWRGGGIRVNGDGYLAADNGLPLKALIEVPQDAGDVRIARDGRVTAQIAGQSDQLELGRIDIAQVRDATALEALGGGLFGLVDEADATVSRPDEDGNGALVQGSLESSNVDLNNEIVGLLLMQRAYAAGAQLVQAGDQLMAIANNLRR